MSEDRTQTGFQVDEADLTKAKENCEFGELSEELRRTVRELAYGREKTRREELKDELSEKRDKEREINTEIENLRTKRNEVRRDIEDLENELDNLRDTDAEYEGMLESMESDLHDGARIWGTMSKVEKAAGIAGKTTAEVINELKERNSGVPEEAFREAEQNEPGNWKDGTLGGY